MTLKIGRNAIYFGGAKWKVSASIVDYSPLWRRQVHVCDWSGIMRTRLYWELYVGRLEFGLLVW